MTIIPLLLRPKLWSIRNRVRQDMRDRHQMVRDSVLLAFSLVLMFGLFQGTRLALQKILDAAGLAYLSPALPLSLVLVLLFTMLLFSNSVSALSDLFLAQDLELLLASPLKPWRFFFAKLIEVLFSSSWMALVFGAPVLLAFGMVYSAPWQYYILFPFIVLIFFIIASSLAMLLVSIFARVVPANRTNEILLLVCALAFCSVYFVAKYAVQHSSAFASAQELLKMARVFTVPHQQYLPSYWVSTALSEIILPTGLNVLPHLCLLAGASITIVSLTYLVVASTHAYAYSRARSNKSGIFIASRKTQKVAHRLLPYLYRPQRAVLLKDYRQLSRDMSQAVQLLLLFGLCAVYLYNFNMLSTAQGISNSQQFWWRGFLIISNLSIGAFVLTAIGTRFVFPSVSLEGQSWWLIKTAPLSARTYLRGKLKTWIIPTLLVGTVIFFAGCQAIRLTRTETMLTLVFCWSLSFGIVGLATGLGAEFANFTWEHPSQLAASFGSLIFMLTSTLLIAANVIPLSLALSYFAEPEMHAKMPSGYWITLFAGLYVVLTWVNIRVALYAIRRGSRSLSLRQS